MTRYLENPLTIAFVEDEWDNDPGSAHGPVRCRAVAPARFVLHTTRRKGSLVTETKEMRDRPPLLKSAAISKHVLPGERVTAEEQLRAATVGGEPRRLDGPVQLVAYDPAWHGLFAREADRVRTALGERVLLLEHVGSTSVPGLAAKPKIDILLAVADSADEPAYVPAMEAAGYVLHNREPVWYEHRMFKGPDTAVHLHVFSPGCPEIERMLLFRDRLLT